MKDEYAALLSEILKVTDEIEEAIRASDTAALNHALHTRDFLCAELSRTGAALDMPRSEESVEQIAELAESILYRQSECEKLLTVSLRDCGKRLIPHGRRRELHSMYRAAVPERTAVFLDSRL
ncbi:MAG: hypothetical protein ACYC2Y_04260 [Armatimonadota bacterium]